MKFGLFIPQGWRHDLVGIDPAQHWGVMAGLARRADGLHEWTSLWVYDHFHPVPEPTDAATHEAWSLMAAFAAVTGRIRLGQMCTCMGYRNPAYLAKVAATVDIVSEGRLEMGIGAGWYEHEWRAYGYGFPTGRERLRQLEEGVQIFRQMWTTGRSTFSGQHYQTDGALCFPQPLQGTSSPGSRNNGIPMWIAGGGEKVTLRIAAQYADYTNFFGPPEELMAKDAILKAHCAALGRDESEIVRSTNLDVIMGRTDGEVQDRLGFIESRLHEGGVSDAKIEERMAMYRRSPATGTIDQVATNLADIQDAGITYAICNFPDAAYDTTGMEIFEREIIPAFIHHEPEGFWDRLLGD